MPEVRFFETHCHLNHTQFEEDYDAVLARARAGGVARFVLVGADLESSRRAVELARPEEGLFATGGIHPHDAETWDAGAERKLRRLLGLPGVVALGEIGLDFYRDLSPRDSQYAAFRSQLDLAAELGLPIIVHTRESVTPSLDVMEPYARAGLRGIMHCWSGTVEEAQRALDLGFLLGVGGVLTYKKPGDLPEVVNEAPLERLVLETDCPYLTPVPHRGKRNEPAYIPLIAEKLAEIKETDVATVAKTTYRAAETLLLDERFANESS
jgi:TatD DNase family protein